jgi:hypothetical protein
LCLTASTFYRLPVEGADTTCHKAAHMPDPILCNIKLQDMPGKEKVQTQQRSVKEKRGTTKRHATKRNKVTKLLT